MRQISLNEKLVVYFVIIGLSGLIITAVFSFYTTREALLNRTFDQLTSVRVNKKMKIESFFRDRLRDVNLLAGTAEVQKIAQWHVERNAVDDEMDFPDTLLLDYIRNYLNVAGYYSNLSLLNSAGSFTRFSIGQKSGQLIITQLNTDQWSFPIQKNIFSNGETRIHDIFPDPIDNEPVVFISSPIQGLRSSILILEMSMAEINRIMLENNPEGGLGESGESYLVGADFLMRSQSRFQENSVLKTIVNSKGAQEAQAGKSDISVINDYRDISVLSSFSPLDIPDLNWVILAEIDTAEAMAPIRNLLFDFILIGLSVAILIFTFAYILSRRITSPIIRLKTASGNISQGNFKINLPIKSNDEIGELTSAFNLMAVQLAQQQEQIAAEKKNRLRSIIDGQERERQRLSRDLHDGLGQSLIAIKLQLENYCEGASSGDNEKMEKIKDYFEQTIEDIRRMSNDLAPSVLEEFGLTTAIKNLCRGISQSASIPVDFNSSGSSLQLPKKSRIYIYRMCQEALTNAIKHAQATQIKVNLDFEEQTVKLDIKDNGCGFDVESAEHNQGNGLSNLTERAQLLNGFIQIISSPGHGTRIRFECKIKN
jgi:signal transduction histidine kinase